MVRIGQTEGSVDLSRLAGLSPAGVICEIMREDGEMARLPDLIPYCKENGLKLACIADLIAYRESRESLVEEFSGYWGNGWYILPGPTHGSWTSFR